jgi:hypothetical protein
MTDAQLDKRILQAEEETLELDLSWREIQRRIELFEDVAVSLQHHTEELEDIVGHHVHLDSVAQAGELNRLPLWQQAHGVGRRQYMGATQVVVGIRRRKSVQVRTADGRE